MGLKNNSPLGQVDVINDLDQFNPHRNLMEMFSLIFCLVEIVIHFTNYIFFYLIHTLITPYSSLNPYTDTKIQNKKCISRGSMLILLNEYKHIIFTSCSILLNNAQNIIKI